MISRDDILDMCGLDEREVEALCEHEHIPEAAAAAYGAWLLTRPEGAQRIAQMIRDDIRAAWSEGNRAHAQELCAALRHFVATHPCAFAKPGAGAIAATPEQAPQKASEKA